jgi:tripartite-type tricarboxylate transporter receptor subunit TctC
MMRAATLTALLVVALHVLLAGPGAAADYPVRPIRLLVGASPGGTTDTMARTIAEPLAVRFGQPVLVENRPGAGGNIAAEAVAKAAPDGYTLLVSYTSHTINATLYPKLPFDPVADFSPIAMISTVPSMLVGNPKLPASDLRALIALAKERPGKLTIAIGGIGSSLHLAGDRFKLMAGVNILNVPYKGTAPALTDVLGGQVDLMFISLVTGSAQVKAGNLRAYGVTSPARQPALPDVAAIGEIIPGFESQAWFGVFGPAHLPDAIVEKLNRAILGALEDAKMRERLVQEGANPAALTPAEFAAFVRQDIERWAPVVRASGAKPN